jgi:hypothetical protein
VAFGQQGHQKQFDRLIFAYNNARYVFHDSVTEAEIHGVHLPFDRYCRFKKEMVSQVQGNRSALSD